MKSIPLSKEAKAAGIIGGHGGKDRNSALSLQKTAVKEIKKIDVGEVGATLLAHFRDEQEARGYSGCRCTACNGDMINAINKLLKRLNLRIVRAPCGRKANDSHDHSRVIHGRSSQTDRYPDGCLVNAGRKPRP